MGPSSNRTGLFIRGRDTREFCLSTHAQGTSWGHSRKFCKPGGEASPKPSSSCTLILDFKPPGLWENIYIHCLRQPAHVFCVTALSRLIQIPTVHKVLCLWGLQNKIPCSDPWFHWDFPVWVPPFKSPQVALLPVTVWFKIKLWPPNKFGEKAPLMFH